MSETSFLFSQPTEIQVTLATWQAFRNLGFPSDNIFVGIIDEKIIVAVQNFEQHCDTGEIEMKNFSISIGSTKMRKEQFEELWTGVVKNINIIPEFELKTNYKKIITKAMLVKLVMILHSNKINIPFMEDFSYDKNSNEDN